jgi:ankyrin repeat protein
MNWRLTVTLVIIFSGMSCAALAFMDGHEGLGKGGDGEHAVANEVDEQSLSIVMKMLSDIGGQDNIKKNSGKTLKCTNKGTKKIAIDKKNDEAKYTAVYLNCRENNEVRDGIYEIQVVGNNVEQSVVKRSVNGQLFDAIAEKDLGKVKKLIKSKADVNYTEPLSLSDGSEIGEWTPLMLAVMTRNFDVVKILVSSGAKVNHMNANAFNALWLASDIGVLDIVKYLAKHGANINNSNMDGVTPLMSAAQNGNYDLAAFLLGKHAEINRRHKDGDSALMLAIARGNNRIAQLLISSGADVRNKNKYGVTALLIAAAEGNFELTKALIDHKADVTVKSDSGKSALDIASEKGHTKIVELLKGLSK